MLASSVKPSEEPKRPQGIENAGAVDEAESKSSKTTDDGAGKTAPATVEEQIRQIFPEDAETAIQVFRGESGLNPEAQSITDYTADGHPFSIGLAQINLTAHKIGNLNCPDAFNGRNSHATVKDMNLYQKCVKHAQNANLSLQEARKIYEGRGNTWNAWGFYTTYLKYM